MAIIQISKIQHRTGANVDLPQLAEGELGFATDERRLYIGNDPSLYPPEGLNTTTQTEILTEVSSLNWSKIAGTANTQINLNSPVQNGQLLVANANTWVNAGANSNIEIDLGSANNVTLRGGLNGYVLTTDGTGNVSWQSTGVFTFEIESVTKALIAVLKTKADNNITSGIPITVVGVGGMTQLGNSGEGGTNKYYAKKISTKEVELYTNQNLSIALNSYGFTPADPNTGNVIVSFYQSGSGTPGGSNTQIQFQDTGGAFGGSGNLTFDKTTSNLRLVGNANIQGILSSSGNANLGNVYTGLISATGIANVGSLNSNGAISASGNVTGANLRTVGQISAGGTATVGNINTIGNANVGNLSVTGSVRGNLIPQVDIEYDLGTPNNRWRSLYLSGNTIYLGNTSISSDQDGIASNTLTANNALIYDNITSNTITSTITFAASNQPNITTLGPLTGLTVDGITNLGDVSQVRINGGYPDYTLTTDGLGNLSWAPGGGAGTAEAAGENNWIQYNFNDGFAASANLTFNPLTTTLQTPFVSATGNVQAGNLRATGIASITGNVLANNLNASNVISAAGTVFGGNVSTTGNVTGANLLTGGQVSATGNLRGSSIFAAAGISAVGNVAGGNLSTAGNVSSQNLSATGNANASTVNATTVQSANVFASTLISSTGNVAGGNISTAGSVSANVVLANTITATGNIATQNYFVGNGFYLTGINPAAVTAITNGTSNIAIPDLNGAVRVSVGGTPSVLSVTNTGISVAGNVVMTGNANIGNAGVTTISASGNITTSSSITAVGQVSAGGNIAGANINTGNISATGNLLAANINTGGLVSATGNVVGGNLTTIGNVTGNYIYGNGAFLTGILTGSTGQINNGTSNISIDPNGNVRTSVAGTANIQVVSTTGVSVSGNIATSNNISGANLTLTGQATAAGNITGQNILTGGIISAVGNVTAQNANIVANATIGNNLISANVITGIVSASGNIIGQNLNVFGNANAVTANITSNINVGNNVLTSNVTAIGNVVANNLQASATISATGNITGNNLLGNSVSVTGNISSGANITATNFIGNLRGTVFNGTSNIAIPTSSGNVGITINGAPNVVLISETATSVTGNLSVSANATIGNVLTAAQVNAPNANIGNIVGVQWAGNVVTANANITGGNLLTGGVVSATGNITGANVNTGILSATGNVQAGNLRTAGIVSATGALTSGSINTGLLSASGNVTGANLLTSGVISATQSISGASLSVSGNINANNETIGNSTITSNLSVGVLATVSNLISTSNISAYSTVKSDIGVANTVTVNVLANVGNLLVNTFVQSNLLPNVPNAYNVGNATNPWNRVFTSTLGIAIGNANIQSNVNGIILSANNTYVSNVVASSNINAAGIISSTGNVIGGNINTAGLISATGNIIGNAHLGNTVSVSGNINANSLVAVGLITTTGNVAANNLNAASLISSAGNVVGANLLTAGQVSATGAILGALVSVPGNITGSNLAVSNANVSTNLIVTGNANVGNLGSAGIISAAGNLTAANVTTGVVTATGNVSGVNINTVGNVSAIGNIIGNSHVGTSVSVTANIAGGNINTSGNVLATGNVSGNNASFGSTIVAGGNISGASINATGNVSATGNIIGNAHLGTSVSVTSTIVGGNLLTGGIVSATGNITGNNLNIGNAISATGNVVGGNILTTGVLSSAGNLTAANVTTGEIFATGDITGQDVFASGFVSALGNLAGNNLNATGVVSASGNVRGGNLLTNGVVSALGNVTGNNIIGSQANISGTLTTGILSVVTTLAGSNLSVSGNVTALSLIGTNGNINANLRVGNNATVGNLSSLGNITAVGTVKSNVVQANYTNTSNLQVSGSVQSSLIPEASYSLGNGANPWDTIAVSNSGISVGVNSITSNLDGLVLGASTTFANTANIFDLNVANKAYLGSIDNVKIEGGAPDYLLATDGAGNLRFDTFSALLNAAGSNGEIQYNLDGKFAASSQLQFTANGFTLGKFAGNGAGLFNIAGANIAGSVPNAIVAGTVSIPSQANITAVGNLANLSVVGNIRSQNANLGNLASANFFQGVFTAFASNQPNIRSLGSLTGLTVSNIAGTVNFEFTSNVSLGQVSNLRITGGSNGQFLRTDGFGGLSFANPVAISVANGISSITIAGNSNISFNVAGFNDVVNFGPASQTVNVTAVFNQGASFFNQVSLGTVNNLQILGGSVGQVLTVRNTLGGVEWQNAPAATSLINGNSNVIVQGNSDVRIGSNGIPNVGVFSNLGLRTTGLSVTGTSNLGPIGNVKISGGSAGFVLTTDGAGTLSFTAPPQGTQIFNGNSNVVVNANANIDIYSSSTLSARFTPDTQASFISNLQVNAFNSTGVATLGPIGNIKVIGGNPNDIISTDGLGNLFFTSAPIGTQLVSGNSNVIVDNGGNIRFSSNNVANVARFTPNGLVTNNITVNSIFNSGLANLNNIANVQIFGGSAGQLIVTDGAGTLSFANVPNSAAIANGTSNLFIPAASGNIRVSVGGTANVTTFSNIGLQTQNLFSSSIFNTGLANFTGGISNVKIPGGSLNQVIVTDGAGNLSFSDVPVVSTLANGVSNIAIANGGFIRFAVAGTANATVFTNVGIQTGNVTSNNLLNSGISNLNNISNVKIFGGSANNIIMTDGLGNLSFVNAPIAPSIVNGSSNVVIDVNGNVRTSVSGVSNVLVVSNTGISVTGNSFLGSNANVRITGGLANYLLSTDGTGSLTWIAPPIDNRISNGTSNVTVDNNSNINMSVAGVSGIFRVTNIGANTNTFTANSIFVSNVSNLRVPGGVANQILAATDNLGNLGYINIPSPSSIATSNGSITIGTSPNITFTVGGLTTGVMQPPISTEFFDVSDYAAATTRVGNPNPLNTGPMSGSVTLNLNDNVSYLSVTTGSVALTLGSDPFTLEMWVVGYNPNGLKQTLFTYGNIGTDPSNYTFEVYIQGNAVYLSVYQPAQSSASFTIGAGFNYNSWYHIAVTRTSSQQHQIYFNGSLIQAVNIFGFSYSSPAIIRIGAGKNLTNNSVANYFFGYISNLRLVKGVQVYTSSFIVPTTPLQKSQSAGTNISAITASQTSLLLVNVPSSVQYSQPGGFFVNGNLVPNANLVLSGVANIKIPGGSAGQTLITDGTGNLSFAAAPTTTSITNGTSNINITPTNGNILFSANGVSNVFVLTSTVANVTVPMNAVNVSATGNVIGGNLITGGAVSASGLIRAGQNLSVVGVTTMDGNLTVNGSLANFTQAVSTPVLTVTTLLNGAGTISITGNITGKEIVANAITSNNSITSNNITATVGLNVGNIAATGQISTTGAVRGASVLATGVISTTGDISAAGVIYGNGSGLTGVTANVSNINNGTSNVTIPTSAGNIGFNVGGTNVMVASANVVSISKDLNVGEDISAVGNIVSDKSVLGTVMSASGNITGNYIFGNGAFLTGVNTSVYGNANVAAYLPTYTGNLTANNISLSGTITGALVSNVVTPSSGPFTVTNIVGIIQPAGNNYAINLPNPTSNRGYEVKLILTVADSVYTLQTPSGTIEGAGYSGSQSVLIRENLSNEYNIYSNGTNYIITAQLPVVNNQGVNIRQTTAATSPTSGALIVAGGVGIGGSLNVGGTLTLSGALNLATSVSAPSATIPTLFGVNTINGTTSGILLNQGTGGNVNVFAGSTSVMLLTSTNANILAPNLNANNFSLTGSLIGPNANFNSFVFAPTGYFNTVTSNAANLTNSNLHLYANRIENLNSFVRTRLNIGIGPSPSTYIESGNIVGANLVGPGSIIGITTANVTNYIGGNVSVTSNVTANGVLISNAKGDGRGVKVGDGAWLGDVNIINTLSIRGQQNDTTGYISFGSDTSKLLGRSGTGPLTYNGDVSLVGNITANNIIGNLNLGTQDISANSFTAQNFYANTGNFFGRLTIPLQTSTANYEIIRANIATSDFFNVSVGGVSTDTAHVSFNVGNEGNEFIYFNQYTGTVPTRTLTLLDNNGNTTLPGNLSVVGGVQASSIIGNISIVAPSGSTANIINATMAGSDYFRIQIGGTSEAGFVSFDTADDAAETIQFRQYSNSGGNPYGTPTRTLTLLDSQGNTTFPTGSTVNATRIVAANLSATSNVNAVWFNGQLSTTGTVNAASANITDFYSPNANIFTHLGNNISVTANINGGNLRTTGLVTATGNVIAGNLTTTGLVVGTEFNGTTVSVTGNITGASLVGNVRSNTISVLANIFGGNLSTTGNVTANVITGNTLSVPSITANISACSAAITEMTGTNVSVIGTVTSSKFVSTTTTDEAYKVGANAFIGDPDVADSIIVKGGTSGANGFIIFGNADSTAKLGRIGTNALTYTGNFSVTSNINAGNLSVSGTITGNVNIGNADVNANSFTSNNFYGGNFTGKLFSPNITGSNVYEWIRANVADSDFFRLNVGGTGITDQGFVSIDVGDNGNESVHVRQYTGGTINRTLTLLDSAGNTTFPGNLSTSANITANVVTANIYTNQLLTGNADILFGNIATNDQFRFRAGGTGLNDGFVEIATAGSTRAPIYIRQYTGSFASEFSNLTLLDGTGNTVLPGNLSVIGNIIRPFGGSILSVTSNLSVTESLTVSSFANAQNFRATNTISAAGSITGASIITGNATIFSTGLISTAGSISAAGNLTLGQGSAVTSNLGNLVRANYFQGDGGLLTNISIAAGTSIVNGTSNVVVDLNGNIRFGISGTANAFNMNSSLANFINDVSMFDLTVRGNASVVNRFSVGGNLSAAGNIRITGLGVQSMLGSLTVDNTIRGALLTSTGNIEGVRLSVSSNVTAGSISTFGGISGVISAAGNVNTDYWFNGNLIATTANIQTLLGTVTSATGNINANNFNGNLTATSASITSMTGSLASVTGNLTGNIVVSSNTAGTGENFRVATRAWIGEVGINDTVMIKGQANAANGYIIFGNGNNSQSLGRAGTGPLTYNGDLSLTGNLTATNLFGTVNLSSSTLVAGNVEANNFRGIGSTNSNFYGTLYGVHTINALSGTANLDIITANIATTDYFKLTVGGTSPDQGFISFDMGDNGNEPIYFRQLNGLTVTSNLALLDSTGNTVIPGNLSANGNVVKGSGFTLSSSNISITGSVISATGFSANSTGISTAGNITASSFFLANSSGISTTGNVTGQYFIGGLTRTLNNNANFELVRASNIAFDDFFRIIVGANTSTDAGYVSFDTADNGTEPIYFRQYTGTPGSPFTSIYNQVTLLDTDGNTRIQQSLSVGGSISVAGNINMGPSGTLNVSAFSATGNINLSQNLNATGNVNTSQSISAVGTVRAASFSAIGGTGAIITATGNITGLNLVTSGVVTATGDITGANIFTAGRVSATGNLDAGNLRTSNIITATGNITTSGTLIGNVSATLATITTASVTTLSASGNITTSALLGTASGANIIKVGTQAWLGDPAVADSLMVTGGTTAANGYIIFGSSDNSAKLGRAGTGPLTYSGNISATGNITANNFIGNLATGSDITANNITGNNFYGNIKGVLTTNTLTGTQTANLINSNIADSDFFRVVVGGTGIDQGYVSFETGDNGNEPIYFKQFSGGSPSRTLTLLDASGNTLLAGNLSTSANITANILYASSVNTSVTGTTTANIINTTMAGDDYFRLQIGGASASEGFVSIDVANEGNEAVYVRQYITDQGNPFGQVNRQITLLDSGGNTTFPGTLSANGNVRVGASLSVTANVTAVNLTGNLIGPTLTGTNNANLILANIATDDYFRIQVGGTAANAGFVSIDTADNGNEPIYVRQYTTGGSGPFTTVSRELTLLDANGNTTLPGNIIIGGANSTIYNSSAQYPIGYRGNPVRSTNTNYTLNLSDAGWLIYFNSNAGSLQLNIPTDATAAFPIGTEINVINDLGAGYNISVIPAVGVTLKLTGTGTTGTRTISNWGLARIIKVGTDSWFIDGPYIT